MVDGTATRLFVNLGRPEGREAAARALASVLRVEDVIVLVRDPAAVHFIPAPGFAATIRGGPSWRELVRSLATAARRQVRVQRVEMPAGTMRDVHALVEENIALVCVGGEPDAAGLAQVQPLLPLLSAALEAEQQALFARGEAAEARAAANRAHALAVALDSARAEGAKLNAELREEHSRRDDFLAMLAHELRNPLSPLATSLELLRRRGTDDLAAKQLDIMARQTRQLSRLVEDLLDVSRVRRGRIELRRSALSLSEVLADSLEAARPLLEARHHEVELQGAGEALYVQADPVRLAQVFANLLHNAAKYTDPGGRIKVSLRAERNDALVRFEDSGIGISREMLRRIFDLFVQAPVSLDRSQGGLGIGLTLVRALVELHGGRITAESAGLGEGSAFTVALPLVAAPVGDAGPPRAQPARTPGRTLRVLIVEDNEDAAESLAEVTRLSGHEVQVAYGGITALQLAADLDPDLILLDLGLPEIDGYEVARRLRRSVKRNALLVAITGYGSEEDKRRSRDAGFDDHIVKPVMPDALERVLHWAQERPAACGPEACAALGEGETQASS